jgi:hypothetical protein
MIIMKEEQSERLSELIKTVYETEPLKINLSMAVTEKLFDKKKTPALPFDNWLYFVIGIISVSILAYCAGYFYKFVLSPVFVMVVFAGILYCWLAAKEIRLYSKRLV